MTRAIGGFALHWRMLLVVLVPLMFVAAAITGFLGYRYAEDTSAAQTARSGALARQMQEAAAFALFFGNAGELSRLARGLVDNDPLLQDVAIFDAEGRLLASAQSRRVADPLTARPRVERMEVRREARAVADPYLDESPLAAASSSRLGEIELRYDDGPRVAAYLSLLKIAAAVAAIAVLAGIAMALTLAQSLSRPLLSIARAVARIGEGELNARVGEGGRRGHGVLAPLAHGIDDMAMRLASAREAMQARIDEATAELRAQRDAAERATQAKSRFLAAASHDLRQPMQAIALFVHRLRTTPSEAERRALTAQVDAAAVALQEKLGALLDLSRLEGEQLRTHMQRTTAAAVIEPVLGGLRPLAEAKHLSLRFLGGRQAVVTDPTMLASIVGNLVSNAIKFSSAGGVLVTCRRRGERVRIAVWDRGVGIPATLHADIFDEYVQVGNAERDPAKGVGIGLSICRRLAHAMETRIGLRSQLGRGSVFWIDVPAADAAAGEKTAMAALPALPVLLVDCDRARALALEQKITDWGVAVHTVCGLVPAHAALQSASDYSAVICRAELAATDPDGSLFDALRQAHERTVLVALGSGAGVPELPPDWQAIFGVRFGVDAPPGRLRALLTRPRSDF